MAVSDWTLCAGRNSSSARLDDGAVTLVTTEISPQPPAYIVMAADQRISRDGKPDSNRRKLFAIPGGRLAGISYFGLAEVQLASKRLWMDKWLQDFLNQHTTESSLGALADALALSLNNLPRLDRTQRSGFQLAGLASDGTPEFWFVRNVDDDGQPVLGEWQAREDFRRRDAHRIAPDQIWIYRNGDYRAHVAAWGALDASFGQLLELPDFSANQGPQAHLQMVRFKMDTIAAFYDQFATRPIVGRPVDAILIAQTGVRPWRRWPGLPVPPFHK
jgi:hypothetical protein